MTLNNNKNDLFRLAAVLYADNNYEVSTKTIQRKIIESALIELNQNQVDLHQLIDFVDDKYSIIIGENELIEITNNQDYFITKRKEGNLFISLSNKRKATIDKKVKTKNIDFFIDKFSEDFNGRESIKKLVYDFLYHMFSVNTASFQKLINKDKDITDIISIQDLNYSDEEINLINDFLNWDNEEKNKCIFDISSYSLEFCLLTNKKGAKNFKLNNLKNKTFYLDTNVIYRVLGINGIDRKKRTETFLNKFNEAGEKLCITKITDSEFCNSINFYVDKLRKVQNPKVNSSVFLEFKSLKDINSFYHEWRKDKINTNLDLFEAYIINEYKLLLDRHNIAIDYRIPYDSEDKETQENLNDLYSSINKEKSIEKQNNFNSIYNDAENILWIEKKRELKTQNIFDTSYFLISTDNQLRKWDYYRNNSTPIVLLPSQWMSILLRYFDRTKDDYKSFVSFLNLRSNEKLIEGEKLDLILSGISEMTNDVEQQRYLVSALIEKGFQNVLGQGASNEEIISQSKKFAKTELEKVVNELNNKIDSLQSTQNKQSDKLDAVLNVKSKMSKTLLDQTSQKDKLREKLISNELELNISKWKRPMKYLIPLGLISIFFYLSMLFFQTNSYNFSTKMLDYIDDLESETLKGILRFLIALPLTFLGWLMIFCYNRINKDKVDQKKKELLKSIKEKFNDENL